MQETMGPSNNLVHSEDTYDLENRTREVSRDENIRCLRALPLSQQNWHERS